MTRKNGLLTTCGFALFVAMAFWQVFFSSELLLPRDNYLAHYPMFQYALAHARFIGEIPDWNYQQGIPLSPFANNTLFLAPYRWVGVVAYLVFGVSLPLAYKLSLFCGQIFLTLGFFFFIERLLNSVAIATFASLLWLLSGTNGSFLHQEHALGTLCYVPWIWYAVLRARQEPVWWIGVASLLGLSVNVHYPQLLMLYYGFIIAASLFVKPARNLIWQPAWVALTAKKCRLGLLALIAFFFSASPLLYSYGKYHDSLVSPFREQRDGVSTTTFAEYDRINRLGPSSLQPMNLLLYSSLPGLKAPAEIGDSDDRPLFVTILVPLTLIALCFLRVPFRGLLFLSVVWLALAATGIHGPLPQLLWGVLPGISLFRQWYHFTGLLSLQLCLLAVVVVAHLWRHSTGYWRRATAVVCIAACFQGAVWSMGIYQDIQNRMRPPREADRPLFSEANNFGQYIHFFPWPHFVLAVPKALEPHAIRAKYPFDVPQWVSNQAPVALASPEHWQSTAGNGGMQFQVMNRPPEANELWLRQFDDGNWLYGSSPKSVSILTSEAHEYLRIPLQSENFFLRRVPSLWRYLILLMWFPLGVFCYVILRPRFCKSSSANCHPVG